MNNLKLIHHKEYLYLVDESLKPVEGNYYRFDVGYASGIKKADTDDIEQLDLELCIPAKVIAHYPLNGAPLLKGVMLMVDLPEREDDTKIYSEACRIYDVNDVFNQYAIGGYVRGYKAASKQYTEDDIDAAFLAGSNHQSEVDALRFQAEDYNTALTRFKDSLSPVPVLPVDYALHTQACCDYICNGSCEKYGSTIVPITIPNEQGVEVLQGKWIY